MTEATDIATVADKLSSLGEGAFAIVTLPAKDAGEGTVEACRSLAAGGGHGVYVALSKDYLSVATSLKASGVDMQRISFVDAVSRMYGIAPVDSAEVTYVDGPLSVDALMQGIAERLRALQGSKRFLVFDSLTTLLLYNSLPVTLAFTQSLRDLLKREHAAGVIVLTYVDDLNEELLEKLRSGGGEVMRA